MDPTLEAFLAALNPTKQKKPDAQGRVLVTCWAHDDTDPSASVWVDPNGKIALNCFACGHGRHLEQALPPQALNIARQTWGTGSPNLTAYISHTPRQPDPTPNGQTTYTYHDHNGNTVGIKIRQPGKKFMWADRKGPMPPYRLPDILAARAKGDPIFIVEGEKDADRLAQLGLTATTAPDGSNTWHTDYAQWFQNADVVILPDNDEPGTRYAETIAENLQGVAHTIRWINFDVGHHGDVSDWLDQGHTRDDLLALVDDTPPFGITLPEWVANWHTVWDIDTDTMLVAPMFLKGRGHSLYAKAKEGKSLFLLWLIVRELQRTPNLVVLYLDYEMGQVDLVERLNNMGIYEHQSWIERLLYAMFPPIAPLDTEQGADELLNLVDTVQHLHPGADILIVIDTISRAVEGEENSADTYRAFYRHTGMKLKARKLTWVRVDHAGKEKGLGQRGSSAKNDDVDVVWELTRHTDSQGNPAGVTIKPTFQRVGNLQTHTYGHQDQPLRFLEAEASLITEADKKLATTALDAGIQPGWGKHKAWTFMRDNIPESDPNRLTRDDTHTAVDILKTGWRPGHNTRQATQEEAF